MKSLLPLAVLLIVLFSSCYKEVDPEALLSGETYYTPTYSIPIGPLEYDLPKIMPYFELDTIETDTVLDNPFIFYIIYDDTAYFYNPVSHDTSFLEPINFNALINDTEYIQSIMLRTNYANGLPVDMTYQFYLQDENENNLDTLTDDGELFVPAGAVDNNGIVVEAYEGREEFEFDSTRIDMLMQARWLKIDVSLKTQQGQNRILKLYSDDGIALELAVRTKLRVPVN